MSELREFIQAILPAISVIDSGCSVCIGRFVDSVNVSLEGFEAGFRIAYNEPGYDDPEIVDTEADHE